MRRLLSSGLVLAMIAIAPGAVVAQDQASPSAGASASPIASVTPATPAQPLMPSFEAPRWTRVSVSVSPAARENHTWTVDAEGRYAYLFGGRDGGKSFDDLWRYDLENDTWEKLSPGGGRPSARFGHNAVWADGFGVVVFAGQRGTDFFGDLWAYDPATDRWTELPADGAAPKRRYGSCMIVGPDGRLWISHGFTFTGRFDDTRAYNLKTRRWAAITPKGRKPGERCLHGCFTNSSGELVLYGGQDNSVRALGDLWVMSADKKWQRQPDPKAKARRLYAVTEAGDYAYIFGGAGKDDQVFDDLLRVHRTSLKVKRVNVQGASPPARFAGTLITDHVRGRVLLFGGKGQDAKSDLWQLTDMAAASEEAAPSPSAEPIPGDMPVESEEIS